MNKTLSKAFMYRAKLKGKFNKNPSEVNHTMYKRQRNYCSNLLKRVKKDYYNNLNMSIFKDNKTFWANIRPLFSDKMKGRCNEIILIENNEVISETNIVADKLNNHFLDSVKKLRIESYVNDETDNFQKVDSKLIEKIIRNYKNHPSIHKIMGKFLLMKSSSSILCPLSKWKMKLRI